MKTAYLRICFVILILISFSFSLLAKSKAYMGVYLSDLATEDYEKKGLSEFYGVEISKIVEDGPADKAGLQKKDVIMEIAGDKIYTSDQITKMLSFFEPGQVLKLKIRRDSKLKDINLTLGEKKSYFSTGKAYIGVYLADLSAEDYKEMGLDKNYGVMISSVVEEGPAAKAGIQDKDVLMEIDNEKIYTADQITKMLKSYKIEQQVKIIVFRGGKLMDFTVTLGEKEWGVEFFGQGLQEYFSDPGNVFVYKYSDKDGKWLGVTVMELTDQMLNNNKIENGLLISSVLDGTPAQESGLQAGDIILEIDNTKINKSGDIGKVLAEKEINQEITVKISRDKKIMDIKSKVGERKDRKREEKVELSIDEGDIRIWIDGEGEILYDLDKATEQLKHLKDIQKDIIISRPDTEGEMIELESLDKNLQDLELQIELLESKKEQEL